MMKRESSNFPTHRDDRWLSERLARLWASYFSDILPRNEVTIIFGRKSKTRLGSIGMPGWRDTHRKVSYKAENEHRLGVSVITITGHFKDPIVPEYVLDATIGHELVHYAHGFHSPYPQLYRYPHQGGIVDFELKKRGMGEILKLQKQWLKSHWQPMIAGYKRPRRRRYVRLSILRPYFGA